MTHSYEVLVLDDDHDSADMLAEVLAMHVPEAVFRVVYTGEDAVVSAARSPIAVAILDLEMSGMGGEAAAREIRSHSERGGPLLVALSGNPLRLSEFGSSGPFDHVLSKPVDVQAIVRLMADTVPPR